MLKNVSDQIIILRFGGCEKQLMPGEMIVLPSTAIQQEMLARHVGILAEVQDASKPEPKVEPKNEAPKQEVKKNVNIGNKRRNHK